jgi:hypothetical protein
MTRARLTVSADTTSVAANQFETLEACLKRRWSRAKSRQLVSAVRDLSGLSESCCIVPVIGMWAGTSGAGGAEATWHIEADFDLETLRNAARTLSAMFRQTAVRLVLLSADDVELTDFEFVVRTVDRPFKPYAVAIQLAGLGQLGATIGPDSATINTGCGKVPRSMEAVREQADWKVTAHNVLVERWSAVERLDFATEQPVGSVTGKGDLPERLKRIVENATPYPRASVARL